jgi:hypothetical protein
MCVSLDQKGDGDDRPEEEEAECVGGAMLQETATDPTLTTSLA